jgi:hypothetical protein
MNILETEYQKYFEKASARSNYYKQLNESSVNENNQDDDDGYEILTLDEFCEEQLTALNFYSENEGKDNGYFFLHPAPEDVRMHRIQLYDEIMAYKNSK